LKPIKIYFTAILLLLLTIFAQVTWAQTATSDSIKKATALRIAESKAAIAKQKELLLQQKATREAETKAKKELLGVTIKARQFASDSTAKSRTHLRDSITNARATKQKIQEKLVKYKDSKKYADSVDRVKRNRADSISYTRLKKLEGVKKQNKINSDAIAKARKMQNEIRNTAFKEKTDSIAKARKIVADALKTKRKIITDSLAKIKKAKNQDLAAKKKIKDDFFKKNFKTDDEKKLAAAMKEHEKKKTTYSNQLFLKKPWSTNRKIYQNTVTRYNYYYNAKNRYVESITNLETTTKDDFSKLIKLNKINIDEAATAVGANMDSVLKKCATSIQIHDPRGRWFDDLYMLMGKAYFLKGDMDNAITTFQYISNEYKDKVKPLTEAEKKEAARLKKLNKNKDSIPKDNYSIASKENRKGIHLFCHQPVRNDALLWLVKCYVQLDNYNDALTLINILQKDDNFPNRLQSELNILNAQIFIANNDFKQATQELSKALERKNISNKDRRRIGYLLGQLLMQETDYTGGVVQFEKILKLHPELDMDFYSKLNIAKSKMLIGTDIDKAENMFKTIINDGKYTKYLDKAYLTLGQLQHKNAPLKAIKSLQNANADINAGAVTKAEAFTELGNIYFEQEAYTDAKISYDSALNFASDKNSIQYNEIETRRNLLTDLVKELEVIHVNDSLIALSQLSKKEQIAKIKKSIKDKNKADKNGSETKGNAIEKIGAKTEVSWYFTKPELLAAGKTQFEQKWGTRPNVDNWRRLAAINTLDITNNIEDQAQEETKEETQIENSKDAAFNKLLEAIPTDTAKLGFCNRSRANSLYNVGVIYYAGLNNDTKAIEYLEKLVAEYPDYANMQQAYYSLYLASKRLPNAAKAAQYLALLENKFPDSKLSKMASDTTFAQSVQKEDNTAVAYYDATYELYTTSKYAEILTRVSYARATFPEHPLTPKFQLLNAMAVAQLKNYPEAKKQLQAVIQSYAGKEEATLAQDILALLSLKDTTLKDSNEVAKVIPSFDKSNASVGGDNGYNYEPNTTHYFMFVLNKIDDRINPLKSAFSDFNSIKHSLDNIQNTMSLVNQYSGVIFFKQFKDAKAANKYLNEVSENKLLYSVYQNSEFEMAIISAANYDYYKNTRDLQAYLKFYKKKYK
jgi:tetratricopeptide (TPR) repeat protein